MAKDARSRITLKDVANRAGVSAMTVSRALAGKAAMVSPALVERITRIAQEMGYTPNLAARSLRGEHLPTIVVFAEHISSHQYLAELTDCVARSLEGRGYGVIACQSSGSLLDALRQFKLAGAVILAPPEALFYDAAGRPTNHVETVEPAVVIHCAVEQSFLNEVSPDLTDAAYQAAAHLLSLGHRRLGFLGGPDPEHEAHWFHKRQIGVERALSEHNGAPGDLRHQPCPHADLAAAALQQLLRREPETTGIICLNDEIAIAAIHAASALGRNVPRDLSVIGGNDIRLARYFSPALTTLAIDVDALVETGLNILFEEVRSGRRAEGKPIRVVQRCQLVVRGSTAPPRR